MKTRIQSLSKLPKARRWTSIKHSDELPGLVAPLFPFYEKPQYRGEYRGMGYGDPLDPAHPATRLPAPRKLPHFRAPSVGVNIYPVALLARWPRMYGQLPFLTWRERVQKAREEGFTSVMQRGRAVLAQKVDGGEPVVYTSPDQVYPKNLPVHLSTRHAAPKGPLLHHAVKRMARRVPMAASNATSKKRVGALATVRSKIAKRLMAALQLITTRGVDVVDGEAGDVSERTRGRQRKPNEKPRVLVFDEEDAGLKWSMQGWTYIWYPTSAMYNMPYTELIPELRLCLEKVNDAARRLENVWLADALLRDKLPPMFTPPRPFPGPPVTLVSGIDPDASELRREGAHTTHEKTPSVVKQKRPLHSATGKKPRQDWQRELTKGLAILEASSGKP